MKLFLRLLPLLLVANDGAAASREVGLGAAQSGLVAAYGLDEGTGTTVADASGNGNTGTISGAAWVAQGKYGKALWFDGTDDWVTIAPSASLELTQSMTLEAWVYPTANPSGWRTTLVKEPDDYYLYAGSQGGPLWAAGGFGFGTGSFVVAPSALPVNTWSHIAFTYDGAWMRLYVNGTQVAASARTGAAPRSGSVLRLGGNATYGEFFQGRIDEVRIYNRALIGAEIQADMNSAVSTLGPDTTAPTVSITSPAAGATLSGTVTVSAQASDNVAVAGVQFRLDGANLGSEVTAAPYQVSWNTAATAPGVHSLTAVARDAAGNSTVSAAVSVTVTPQGTPVLALAGGSAAAGSTLTVPLSLSGTAVATRPSALQFTLTFAAADFTSVAATVGAAASAASKNLSCVPASGSLKCVVWGLNAQGMADGAVALVQLTLAPSGPASRAVQVTGAQGSSSAGTNQDLLSSGGVVTVTAPPLTPASLVCNPSAIAALASSTCSVTLTGTAGAGGVVVAVSDDSQYLTVPASITVASGAATASFQATATSLLDDTSAVVTVSLNGVSRTVSLTLVAPPRLTSLSCNPVRVAAGSSAACSVELTKVAPAGGVTVSLASGQPNALLVPPSVTVAAGASSASFSAAAGSVPSDQPVTLTATAVVSLQIVVTVQAPPAQFSLAVTPNSGSGSSRTFALEVSHSGGFTNIAQALLLIGGQAAGGCFVEFNRQSGTLRLANDAATAWGNPITIGSSATVENSQCRVSAAASSVVGAGNVLTASIALTFLPAFSGARPILGFAQDHASRDSGWRTLGTWTVGGSEAPTLVSLTPTSGSGSSQAFAITAADAGGASDISTIYLLINSTLQGAGACFVEYHQGTHRFRLANDAASDWLPLALAPGGSGAVENSQCRLSAGGSSTSAWGTTLRVTAALTFLGGFSGLKTVYALAQDTAGLNSGWQALGAWSAGGNSAPSAISVTPSSGSGTSGSFTVHVSDANGFADIQFLYMILNSHLAASGGCFVQYDAFANLFRLANDLASDWLPGGVTPGAAGTLENARCRISGTGAAVSRSGTTVSATLPVVFKAGFSGAKTIYISALDASGASSGWVGLGSWFVP